MSKTNMIEAIAFLLCLSFFYEGMYKMANWSQYAVWLHHAPFIRVMWIPLTYVIPVFEIGLAISLLTAKYRTRSMYLVIMGCGVFVCWSMASIIFSGKIIFPFHNVFIHASTWREKILLALLQGWLAFIALLLAKAKVSSFNKTERTARLHNKPVSYK